MKGLDYLYARQKQVREELARELRNNPGIRAMAAPMERELMWLHEEITKLKEKNYEQS